MRKNRETTENNILFTAKELGKALSGKYKVYRLTIGDLDKAFLNGVSGYYGEVYEIGYVAFCSWIDAYLASDEYLDKIHKSDMLALPQKATLTTEEIERIAYDYIISKFDEYKNTKKLCDGGCICYEYLTKKGLLILDKDKKWSAYHKAEEKKDKLEESRKKKQGIAFKDYMSNFYDKNADIIHTAKLILVEDFFEKIITYSKEESFKKTLLA